MDKPTTEHSDELALDYERKAALVAAATSTDANLHQLVNDAGKAYEDWEEAIERIPEMRRNYVRGTTLNDGPSFEDILAMLRAQAGREMTEEEIAKARETYDGILRGEL